MIRRQSGGGLCTRSSWIRCPASLRTALWSGGRQLILRESADGLIGEDPPQ
jgi:hypothetical protein